MRPFRHFTVTEHYWYRRYQMRHFEFWNLLRPSSKFIFQGHQKHLKDNESLIINKVNKNWQKMSAQSF